MSVEALQQLAGLHVPESAGRVAGTGQHLIVGAGKKAAGHVARVRADGPLLGRHVLLQGERVDGDLVVEASASNHLS